MRNHWTLGVRDSCGQKHDAAKWEVQRVICQAEQPIGISESFSGSSTFCLGGTTWKNIYIEIMLLESAYLLDQSICFIAKSNRDQSSNSCSSKISALLFSEKKCQFSILAQIHIPHFLEVGSCVCVSAVREWLSMQLRWHDPKCPGLKAPGCGPLNSLYHLKYLLYICSQVVAPYSNWRYYRML